MSHILRIHSRALRFYDEIILVRTFRRVFDWSPNAKSVRQRQILLILVFIWFHRYNAIKMFISDNMYYIDLENRALLLSVTTQRWLSVRLGLLGSLMVGRSKVCDLSF